MKTVLGLKMVKKKVKPVLPSLRERKRYLAFEILSKSKITDYSLISREITENCLKFIGELGAGKAGIMILEEKFNPRTQRGLIKVNNKYLNELKTSLALIEKIKNQPVIIRSLITAGTIKKTERYIAG